MRAFMALRDGIIFVLCSEILSLASTCARVLLGAGLALAAISPAPAQENIAYTYDSLGRLVQVAHAGTVNNGISATYTYDPADNRTNVAVAIVTAPITLSPTSLPNGAVGTAYSQTISASGGTGGYSYSVSSGTLPAGLSLNSSSGVLSGTPTTATGYSFTITATDSSGATGSRAYSVTINAAITLSPTALHNGTVGSAYSQTITASGGSGGYSYAVGSGTLPAGLSLNSSTGVLSGTPTTAASSSFTITATDSSGATGSCAYSVTINVTITLSPTSLPAGTVGTAYNQTITASGGGSPYTYATTSGTLPTGLTLSSGGVLSGTPSAAGTYSFTITATDRASYAGNRSYSVTINSGTH